MQFINNIPFLPFFFSLFILHSPPSIHFHSNFLHRSPSPQYKAESPPPVQIPRYETAAAYIRRKNRERRARNATVAITEDSWTRSHIKNRLNRKSTIFVEFRKLLAPNGIIQLLNSILFYFLSFISLINISL